jgi:hypothetical protein
MGDTAKQLKLAPQQQQQQKRKVSSLTCKSGDMGMATIGIQLSGEVEIALILQRRANGSSLVPLPSFLSPLRALRLQHRGLDAPEPVLLQRQRQTHEKAILECFSKPE